METTTYRGALCCVLLTKYQSGDQSRRRRWKGHVARMWEMRDAYRVLVGKPEGRRSLGKPRRRWEDNIKMDLREVRSGAWTGSNWLRIGTGSGLF